MVSGNKFWVEANSAFGPAEEFQPPPLPPSPEPPPPSEQVFCPAIPEGFWNPHGGPPEDFVHQIVPWKFHPHPYQFAMYGMISDLGRRNSDGSITIEITFNYQGEGIIRTKYNILPSIFLGLFINGETSDVSAIQISPDQVCKNDVVLVTSNSHNKLDPRVPPTDPERGKELDGPFYVKRYRR